VPASSADLQQIETWLQAAMVAARAAGDAIMEVYDSGEFATEAKADDSPLTRADRESHRIIADLLAASGLPVLSEEGKSIPYEDRYAWEWYWLVDPLDGTKEFIKRNGDFTVNIALMRRSEPVAGAICIPVSKTLYAGIAGQSAHREDSTGRLLLQPRQPVDLTKPGVRVVASRSHRDPQTEAFIASLESPEVLSRGSSLKFLLLADNKADVYPRYAPTMEWDTAAAQAILGALGIRLLGVDDSLPLRYNKQNLLNPYFICKS